MSKFTKTAKKANGVNSKSSLGSSVVNYENGSGYTLDPVATLRIMAASSIFGEPAYYENSNDRARKMEAAIDNALTYDFAATLNVIAEMRQKAWMRLNPQIMFVRAAMHPARSAFTSKNPGMFDVVENEIVWRPDDITTQVEYFIATNGGKNNFPGILKRAATKKLATFGEYHIRKYANRGIGLIDVVRILNTKKLHENQAIHQLMHDGKVSVENNQLTWKELRSVGKSWGEILQSGITLSHQDYLYQLGNIMADVTQTVAMQVKDAFLRGVNKGNVWPYKYMIAYNTLSARQFNNKGIALSALNEALSIRLNKTKRKRSVAILVDVSSSMTDTLTSISKSKSDAEGMRIDKIAALSGALTAKQYELAYFVPFGTSAKLLEVDTNKDIVSLMQILDNETLQRKYTLGHGTNMDVAVRVLGSRFVDEIFIYSDMQSTGDVWAELQRYRKFINPNTALFTVQVAGYNNSILPENQYRGANLAGWTGKEVEYAWEIQELWDSIENGG